MFSNNILLVVSLAKAIWVANAQEPGLCSGLKQPSTKDDTTSNLILTLPQSVIPVVDQLLQQRTFPSREAKIDAIVEACQAVTAKSQAPVVKVLKQSGVYFESYWITNQMYVHAAPPFLVATLKALGDIIKLIALEIIIIVDPIINPGTGNKPPTDPQWNVVKIGANKTWSRNNTQGQGIRVGIIDTGVRATHKALLRNYLGTFRNGWYDACNKSSMPEDLNGHGTHVCGTCCAVAPKAKWLSCRAGLTGAFTFSALLRCGQFMFKPTDAFGLNGNAAFTPHIVSNSWNLKGGHNSFYNDVIRMWIRVGIIPVFAAGNNGPACKTAGSPADQPVPHVSVGSTNEADRPSHFSNRGPSPNSLIVPLMCAPGELINSSWYTSDSAYNIISGTSMACPAVSGSIALLLSEDPTLTLPKIEDLLTSTANQKLGQNVNQCGSKGKKAYPNFVCGYGRIDVDAAYSKLVSS